MVMRNQLIILAAFIFLMACKKDVIIQHEGFVPISEESVYHSLQVQGNYEYYEIRNNYCFDSTRYDVIYSEGIKPYTDSIFSAANEGVFYSSGDLCMYNNILLYDGNEYRFLNTYADIIDFLGPVDCTGDALFVAHLNGYYFKYDDTEFGIKEVTGGFLIDAFKLISACTPLQTDKFLIKIDRNGEISIQDQAVWFKDDNACI